MKYEKLAKLEILSVEEVVQIINSDPEEGIENALMGYASLKEYVGKSKTSKNENYDYINPAHYKKNDMEVWEMMFMIWGKEKFINHCEMSAFKYRMRLGDKPDQPTEREISKIKWYEDKITELKSEINLEEFKNGK